MLKIYTLVLGVCATNTYIIVDNGEAIIIDPAANARDIAAFIAQKNARLKHILITHGHFDHIGAAKELQDMGATLFMSKSDYDIIQFGDAESVFYAPQIFSLDKAVSDGDTFELIGHTFKVVETQGHTAGGVCYIIDDDTIFTGDTLFRLSVGRTDFPYGDYGKLKESLKKLFSLSHDYKILAGHGEPTTLYFEKNNNPYAN